MSDLDENIESSIEQRHKNEKRELQNKIISLKKSVGKNDKKKKKEIADEITKLESELKARHLSELADIQKNETEVIPIVDNKENHDTSVSKVSRAKKRRERKAADEKARIESINKQEEENIHGPRNVETQFIKKYLGDKGLKLHIIPSNGDCLYNAVAHQLTVIGDNFKSVKDLRIFTAQYIRDKKMDFLPFLTNNKTGESLTDEEFGYYCNKIEKTKCWGGQVELQAICEILKQPIHVIQATPPFVIVQGECFSSKPILITYHRHMYGLGEHYNSTKPRDQTDADSDPDPDSS